MNALLILGMHRSGTSALAGQCASMGVWFGDNLLPPRPDNPKGYFEAIDIMLANDQLVTLLFGGWYSPVAWSDVERSFPLDHPRVIEIQQSLRNTLQGLAAGGRLWAVKDPRLSRLLPVWWPLIRAMGVAAGIVMAVRRPAEVVASLEQRDCLGATTSQLLWMRHVAEPLAYALDHDLRIAIMPHHELLGAPDLLSGRLRSIGFQLERQGPVFVDEALRHHSDVTDLRDDVLSQACEELYQTVVSVPVFGRDTAPAGAAEVIRAARDLRLEPYLDRLYFEAMGVASAAQRVFHEKRKSTKQAQERAVRQRLRNKERALTQCQEEVARLRPAKPPAEPKAGAKRR